MGRIMTHSRQIGVGKEGGAEALAIFHQILANLKEKGKLKVLCRVKVDQNNCFGLIEYSSVRDEARRTLPRHYAAAAWKHSQDSYINLQGTLVLKNRGAE